MAGSRAERLVRRTASAATAPTGNPRGRAAPEHHIDPEPRVEHPEDNNDDRTEDDLGEEEAQPSNCASHGAGAAAVPPHAGGP